MLDLISKWLSPETVQAIVAVWAAVVAIVAALPKLFLALNALVIALKVLVQRALPWAEKTETDKDEKLLGILAAFLTMVGPKIEWLKNKCEVWALNRFPSEQVVKAEKSK